MSSGWWGLGSGSGSGVVVVVVVVVVAAVAVAVVAVVGMVTMVAAVVALLRVMLHVGQGEKASEIQVESPFQKYLQAEMSETVSGFSVGCCIERKVMLPT